MLNGDIRIVLELLDEAERAARDFNATDPLSFKKLYSHKPERAINRIQTIYFVTKCRDILYKLLDGSISRKFVLQELIDYLEDRWKIISNKNAAYVSTHVCKVNQACMLIADSLKRSGFTKLSQYQLLMPTLQLEDCAVTLTNLGDKELDLPGIILDDKNERIIEIEAVFEGAIANGKYQHTAPRNENVELLSEQEITRLKRHCQESEMLYKVIECKEKFKHDPTTLRGLFLYLLDHLDIGGEKNLGTEYDSSAVANAAISHFFTIFDALDKEIQEWFLNLKYINNTPGERRNISCRELIDRLRRPDDENYRETKYCIEIISGGLRWIYEEHKTALEALSIKTAKAKTNIDFKALEEDVTKAKEALEQKLKLHGHEINARSYDIQGDEDFNNYFYNHWDKIKAVVDKEILLKIINEYNNFDNLTTTHDYLFVYYYLDLITYQELIDKFDTREEVGEFFKSLLEEKQLSKKGFFSFFAPPMKPFLKTLFPSSIEMFDFIQIINMEERKVLIKNYGEKFFKDYLKSTDDLIRFLKLFSFQNAKLILSWVFIQPYVDHFFECFSIEQTQEEYQRNKVNLQQKLNKHLSKDTVDYILKKTPKRKVKQIPEQVVEKVFVKPLNYVNQINRILKTEKHPFSILTQNYLLQFHEQIIAERSLYKCLSACNIVTKSKFITNLGDKFLLQYIQTQADALQLFDLYASIDTYLNFLTEKYLPVSKNQEIFFSNMSVFTNFCETKMKNSTFTLLKSLRMSGFRCNEKFDRLDDLLRIFKLIPEKSQAAMVYEFRVSLNRVIFFPENLKQFVEIFREKDKLNVFNKLNDDLYEALLFHHGFFVVVFPVLSKELQVEFINSKRFLELETQNEAFNLRRALLKCLLIENYAKFDSEIIRISKAANFNFSNIISDIIQYQNCYPVKLSASIKRRLLKHPAVKTINTTKLNYAIIGVYMEDEKYQQAKEFISNLTRGNLSEKERSDYEGLLLGLNERLKHHSKINFLFHRNPRIYQHELPDPKEMISPGSYRTATGI